MCVFGENIDVTILGTTFDGVGYGDASLIWEATIPELPQTVDSEIFVSITGIDYAGHNGQFDDIEYSVTVFNPDAPGTMSFHSSSLMLQRSFV